MDLGHPYFCFFFSAERSFGSLSLEKSHHTMVQSDLFMDHSVTSAVEGERRE